jgi:hypothetical protein
MNAFLRNSLYSMCGMLRGGQFQVQSNLAIRICSGPGKIKNITRLFLAKVVGLTKNPPGGPENLRILPRFLVGYNSGYSHRVFL